LSAFDVIGSKAREIAGTILLPLETGKVARGSTGISVQNFVTKALSLTFL